MTNIIVDGSNVIRSVYHPTGKPDFALEASLADSLVYYLQQFVDSGDLIDNSITGVDDNTLHNYLQIVQEYIPHAVLRGID